MSQTARADAIEALLATKCAAKGRAGGLCRKRAQEAFKDPLQNSVGSATKEDCERTTISERH